MIRWWLRVMERVTLAFVLVVLLALAVGRGLPVEAQIAYAARFGSEQKFDLYLMNVPRQLVIQLTHDTYNHIAPEWSPDGEQLAFISNRNGFEYLYLASLNTGDQRPLSFAPVSRSQPLWSPDGKSILYLSLESGYPALTIYDVHTAASRPLLNHDISFYIPDWSPDNQHITFISDRSTYGGLDIFSLDVLSGSIQPYLTTQGHDLSLAWSPDGRYLLYTLDQLPPSIFLWDTLEQVFLALDTPVSPNSVPDWSSDGRMLIYTAFIGGGDMGIYQLDISNCLPRQQTCTPILLTPLPGIYASPKWRPMTS